MYDRSRSGRIDVTARPLFAGLRRDVDDSIMAGRESAGSARVRALSAFLCAVICTVPFQSPRAQQAATTGPVVVLATDASLPASAAELAAPIAERVQRGLSDSARVGLVVFDEIVQRARAPRALAETRQELREATAGAFSDGADDRIGNVAVGIERAVDMLEGRSGGRVIVFSRGTLPAADTAERQRFRRWLADVLLPDAAERGVLMWLLTPSGTADADVVQALLRHPGNRHSVLGDDSSSVDGIVAFAGGERGTSVTSAETTDGTTVGRDIDRDADARVPEIRVDPAGAPRWQRYALPALLIVAGATLLVTTLTLGRRSRPARRASVGAEPTAGPSARYRSLQDSAPRRFRSRTTEGSRTGAVTDDRTRLDPRRQASAKPSSTVTEATVRKPVGASTGER